MKKIFLIFLTMLLMVTLVVPVFASDIDGYYLFNDNPLEYVGGSFVAPFNFTMVETGAEFVAMIFDKDTLQYRNAEGRSIIVYSKADGWNDEFKAFTTTDDIPESMTNVYNHSLTFVPTSGPSLCDGTSCPATDLEMDNICDDCGNVLAFSLRNTLYDYAVSLAENKSVDGYPYYAIFQSGDTYYVHISKSPMISTDGVTLEGTGIMYNRVTQSSDGVNGGSGWYNGFYSSYDDFVYANHSLSNFLPAPPLAMVVQGVTEEQMEKTLPTVVGTMEILALCGVGLIALLVVLSLFGKRSLIYPR